MEWYDDGIVLSARKHGESSAIVNLLTREHGRHAGFVRGGASRSARGVYQPGNGVSARWSARLPEHLGTFKCELTGAVAANLMVDPLKLAGLSSACALIEVTLPEREPHRLLFDGLAVLFSAFDDPSWPSVYVKWEINLLQELGFGLDLSACAATGSKDGLTYVSPKSGRAVSDGAAEPYRDKLLVLPNFLMQPGTTGSAEEIHSGLKLTSYFLEHYVFEHHANGLPAARQRLIDRIRRKAGLEASAIKEGDPRDL